MEEEKGTKGSKNLSLNGMEIDGLAVEEVHFRGRKLQGLLFLFQMAGGGFVLAKNNSGKRKACDVSEGNSNDWEMKAKFDKLTYWNHDTPPSKDDPFLRSFHWFTVAEAPLDKGERMYVGVGDSEEVQLFYYFVKSEGKPEDNPLLIWLTGGPGCSAFSGLVFEIGPLKFKVDVYNGSLPTLVYNPYAWTKVSNIIFIDSPVGTGFSYARNNRAAQTGDLKQVHHLHQFLRKWLMAHPDFISIPVYVSGDSYSGIPVPVLAQEISNGNEEGIKPIIHLQV
ncbi:Serine carboxypeptidase-like 15 [Gossypium arboreum]|uniref:Serine carboxypeptidase-like 15 n=1 Tax=Gossypium arboreum TaxID=29729 RepID=A0A0B0PGT4_GOSAR|nr:Serine carboxypeptidase-like 15 [Gossypium arboreum]